MPSRSQSHKAVAQRRTGGTVAVRHAAVQQKRMSATRMASLEQNAPAALLRQIQSGQVK